MTERWVFEADTATARRRCTINEGEFRCRVVLAELAELWLRSASAKGWGYNTASAAATAVRGFVRFLDASDLKATTSLRGPTDGLASVLVDWRTALREKGSKNHANTIFALLERAYFEAPDLQPELQLLATRRRGDYSGKATTPLDEYSNAERLHQQRAASEDIRRAELRIERGARLYDSSPTIRELFAIARREPSPKAVAAELRRHPSLVAEIEAITGYDMSSSAHVAVSALAALLGPTRSEMFSLRLLVQWATGIAPEQVRECRVDDLIFGDAGVHWRSEKRRANKTIDMSFEGHESWKVSGLLARGIAMTARFREMQHSDFLFIAFSIMKKKIPTLRIDVVGKRHPAMVDWAKHHRLSLSTPHDLRRIRKAFVAVRAGVAPTSDQLKHIDHTMSTFEHHYDGTTTSRTLAGLVIVRAQNRLVEHLSSRRAKVLPVASDTVTTDITAPIEIRDLAHEVSNRSATEKSLGASACSAPQEGPFAELGEWCGAAPFACMLCPNAVIFEDHAPQLLLMRESLFEQQFVLRPDEYAHQVFPFVAAVDGYVEQMDATTLANAQASIADGTERFVAPLARRIAL
jgi:hypothetical protein